jgi:hypothetical protein
LEHVSAYAKVEGISGALQAATERATRGVQLALLILKVVHHEHATFFERERFGTFGTFFDPVPRFGIVGSLAEDVRITLSATAIALPSGDPESPLPRPAIATGPIFPAVPQERPAGEYVDRIDKIGIALPVRLGQHVLVERWPVIEELARVFWPTDAGWATLATAVRWFVDGTEASTPEDAFVKYATAIDVLLGREERGYVDSLTTRISERLAFLLGENDPDRRDRVFKACQGFFATRGSIVHGEGTTSEHELNRFEYLARLAILRMAWEIRARGHTNVGAFIAWVHKPKFGETFVPISVPRFLRLPDR